MSDDNGLNQYVTGLRNPYPPFSQALDRPASDHSKSPDHTATEDLHTLAVLGFQKQLLF